MANIQVRFSNKETRAPVTELNIDPNHTIGQLKARVEKELAESEASMMRVFSKWFVERQGEGGGKQLVEITAADSGTSLASFGIEDRTQLLLEGPMTDTLEGVGQALAQLSIQLTQQAANQQVESQQQALHIESLHAQLAQKEVVQRILLKAPGITPLTAFWLTLQDPQQEASCAYAMSLVKDLGMETKSSATDALGPDLLGLTPLLLSTKAGRIDMVVALLATGADAKALDPENNSALHIAAALGGLTLVERFIAAGVDVQHTNSKEQTALYCAATKGHVALIQALAAKGANVNAAAADGRTPLHAAAQYGHAASIDALVAKGADANAVNKDGWTPLYIAAQYGHVAAIEALIAKGANVNAVNNRYTPLDVATRNGHVAAIAALVAKGAQDGWTPLKAFQSSGISGLTAAQRYKITTLLKEFT